MMRYEAWLDDGGVYVVVLKGWRLRAHLQIVKNTIQAWLLLDRDNGVVLWVTPDGSLAHGRYESDGTIVLSLEPLWITWPGETAQVASLDDLMVLEDDIPSVPANGEPQVKGLSDNRLNTFSENGTGVDLDVRGKRLL